MRVLSISVTTRDPHRWLATGVLLASLSWNVTGTAQTAAARVAIVLDLSSLPPRQLHAMTEETVAIWRPYNFSITWLGMRYEPALEPEHALIAIRLAGTGTAGHRAARGPGRTLGSVQFFDGIPDGVIAVSPEEIDAAILRAGWNDRPLVEWPISLREELTGRAMGRVLAHEVGHYLLAAREHSKTGLMRASFAGNELIGADRRRFELDPHELPTLVARLAQLGAAAAPQATRVEP